jgi:hypothetical protein
MGEIRSKNGASCRRLNLSAYLSPWQHATSDSVRQQPKPLGHYKELSQLCKRDATTFCNHLAKLLQKIVICGDATTVVGNSPLFIVIIIII